jgi:plastocyanin
MRKVLVSGLSLAALAALVVGVAVAKTVAVTITKNGYVPKATTIAVGDTVQFTNGDTVVHQLTFKSMTGVACTPSPLVVQPTQSGSCSFVSPGTFSYDDPNTKGNTFRGTITVVGPTTAETLTAAAKPPTVIYAGKVTVSGVLSTQKLGENVDVLATACGQPAASRITTVQTTAGGAYAATVQPLQNTVYTTKVKSTSSQAVAVKVRPRLQLSRVGAHRYVLRVAGGQSFAGKFGTLQRYNGTLARWVNVKRVVLRASSTGVFPTVISTSSFRSTVQARRKLRVVMPQLQVGGCYLPGQSNTILS